MPEVLRISLASFGPSQAYAQQAGPAVGIESEVAGGLGIKQGLQAGGFSSDLKTPDLLNYSANLVLSRQIARPRAVRDGRHRPAHVARDRHLGLNQRKRF